IENKDWQAIEALARQACEVKLESKND
ncbi:keto-deoxy-phosphogluconate aldolase, partial [Pseudoalteromonas sp. S3785]